MVDGTVDAVDTRDWFFFHVFEQALSRMEYFSVVCPYADTP